MKAAPALAAGNAMVTKASERNSFSTLYLAELAVKVGIPLGVLIVVVGTVEAWNALSSHMCIRKISLTGSISLGRQIQTAAVKSNLKRVALELGGKSSLLILEDADLETALDGAMGSSLAMNGQVCVMSSRMYVHESIASMFVTGLKSQFEKAASACGIDPLSGLATSSPLFHHDQFARVMQFIEQGKKEAELVTDGAQIGDHDCFIHPTIF